MKNRSIKNLAIESNEEILASHDFNDERTVAFHSIRKKHKKDSIAWIIGGLLLFFFTLISLGRITIIGQFFDDSIFNLVFGWFKFPVYFVLLTFDICIYLGIYFKFKKRFLLMVSLTSALICWTISLVLLTYIYDQEKVIGGATIEGLWSKNTLKNSFEIYWWNWLEHSIYGGSYAKTDKMELLFSSHGYVSLYAGGGVIGTFLASISAYLSLPAAFLLVAVLFFWDFCWLFTGDPFFFFKRKDKRKGHALRILSLKGKNNPNKLKKKNVTEKDDYQIWKSLNVFDPNVESEVESSDLTIKMPSYSEAEREMNLKEFAEDLVLDEETGTKLRKKESMIFPQSLVKPSSTKDLKKPDGEGKEQEPLFYQSRRKKDLTQDQSLEETISNFKVNRQDHFDDFENLFNEMPSAGHYGNLDPNDARQLFEKDTNLTPFGRQTVKPQTSTIKEDNDATSDTQFFEELYHETFPDDEDDFQEPKDDD